jgi:hypothetical protein
MKLHNWGIFLIIITLVGCAGLSGGLKVLPEPEQDSILLFGCILLENMDRELPFSYWDLPLNVVILGKGEDGKITHHETRTDVDGYYCFPNLPRGSYLLKAVYYQEPGQPENVILNEWEHVNSKYYTMRHPEQGFEYTAQWFPKPSETRIVDQKITWFGLRRASISDMSESAIGDVMVINTMEKLENKRLWGDGYLYTRVQPQEFFTSKFPQSTWWQN